MKAKNFSRVLAFMVAAVMIFSALPLMAFASDEAATYTVSFGAPAIPMDVDTKVDLKTLNVEMAAGTTVSGADIEWATDVTDGIVLDTTKKTVEALAKGNYKLTATAAGVTKNVWVVVRATGETEFKLVDYDFATEAFNTSEWSLVHFNKTSNKPIVMDSTNLGYYRDNSNKEDGHIIIGANANIEGQKYIQDGVLLNTNEIFKDFMDYTVITKIAAPNKYSVSSCGRGPGGRFALTADGKIDQTQSAVYGYIAPNGKFTMRDNKNMGTSIFRDVITSSTSVKPSDDYFWNDLKPQTVKLVLDGTRFAYYVGTTEVFDIANSTEANITKWESQYYADKPGYPAAIAYGHCAAVYTFTVQLNSNAMPATMTDEPEAPAPEADITIVGEGTAKVDAVVGSENTYTVALAPAEGYKLKVGSLVINGDIAHGYDGTGCVYTFTTNDLDNTTIAVEFIEDNGQFNTAMLGATIPTNPEVKGIRFGARTDSIMRSSVDATKGLLNEKINVGGEDYTITDIGMILFPTQLLGGADLTVATDSVVRQSVTTIVGLTDDYSDIAITLTNIPDTMAGVQITSRMYIAYTDADGATQYVYSDTIAKSYDDVVKAIAQ